MVSTLLNWHRECVKCQLSYIKWEPVAHSKIFKDSVRERRLWLASGDVYGGGKLSEESNIGKEFMFNLGVRLGNEGNSE